VANLFVNQILLNYGPAILCYRFISQLRYFGTLNLLAMFIILAIGADDIFVLFDTWQQYRVSHGDWPLDKRMTATLKHAGKVMAVTSLSTVFSFLANVFSLFPGIYTFGAFAAWLVLVNYFAVVTYYPAVLLLHELYFYTPNLKHTWCSIPSCCGSKRCVIKKCCGQNNVIQPSDDNQSAVVDVEVAKGSKAVAHDVKRVCLC